MASKPKLYAPIRAMIVRKFMPICLSAAFRHIFPVEQLIPMKIAFSHLTINTTKQAILTVVQPDTQFRTSIMTTDKAEKHIIAEM